MSMESKQLAERFAAAKVVVVDDEHYMRKVVRTMLLSIGVREVYEAPDGQTGLDLIRRLAPDVVILDWQMPGLDGPAFVRIVRSPATFPYPNVPIIMLTGHGERSRVVEAVKIGVNEFLLKPVSVKALQDRMVSVLTKPREVVKSGDYYGPVPRKLATDFMPTTMRQSSAVLANLRRLSPAHDRTVPHPDHARALRRLLVADRSHRHRPGYDLDARHRVRCRAAAARQRAAGAAPDLSRAGRGRARPGGNLDGDGRDGARRPWRRPAWRPRTSPASASPISARPRSSGTAPPASRSTTPSSGRTGAPPIFAMRCAQAAMSRRSRPRPGCCSTLIFPPARSPGCSTTSRARAAWPRPAGSLSAPSIAFCCGDSPAAKCTRPMPPMPRARCCSISAADNGTTGCAGCSACRRRCCRRCATARASSASPCLNCSARPSACSAWPATSRRRRSGRAASSPA